MHWLPRVGHRRSAVGTMMIEELKHQGINDSNG